MKRELEGLEEGPKAEIHIDLLKTTLKNIKLENARPSWNIWYLVREIHPHSQQNSTRNEQMSPRSARTRKDVQRKDHIGPKRTQAKEPLQTTTNL